MAVDSQRHHRRSVRLKGYDYARAGAYFVTICVHQRECLLGEVIDGQMAVNEWGLVVGEVWEQVTEHWPTVGLDAFVIMPNHFHGIVALGAGEEGVREEGVREEGVREEGGGTPPLHGRQAVNEPELGAAIAYWKYQSTKRVNELRQTPGARLWQRSYHDRIIRNEQMLDKGRIYIANNPGRWAEDVNNPANIVTS